MVLMMDEKTDPNLWRRLRLGDRIRVVRFPEFTMHADTKQAYQYLVGRQRPVTVSNVDEDGMPWIRFRTRDEDGRVSHHGMLINHGGIVLVRPRPKSRRE
jgi:hypothetical protein